MTDKHEHDVGEHALGEIQAFLAKAQGMPLLSVKDIAEQFRVQAMLAKTTPRRRKMFDAIADYYEHAYEVRTKAEHKKDDDDGIGGTVRAILDNFDGNDD
jgi:hypothetical protein